MKIVPAKTGVAFGALSLPGLVAPFDAIVAEDVEALGQNSVLVVHVAAGTSQFRLIEK